jgi:hypothetical protein
MPWSYVGVSSVANVTSGNITLTMPAGVQEGDLLVAVISYRSNAAFTSPGSPWVSVTSQNTGNTTQNSTGSIGSGHMFYCIRGSSDPGLTFTRTAGDVALGRIVAYRGNNISSGVLVTQTSTTLGTAATAINVTGLTTANARDLIVVGACAARNVGITNFDAATDPTTTSGTASNETGDPAEGDWQERADSFTTAGADCGLAIADAIRATAGATGNLTMTAGASARHVVLAAAFMEAEQAASLAVTEGADVADFEADVAFSTITAELGATEGADVAALEATVTTTYPATFDSGIFDTAIFDTADTGISASLSATEAADVAAFAIDARHTASLAVTEGADVAAFAINARHTASLAVTEAPDVAALAINARHTAALAVTEGADVAALAVTAAHTAALAVTEAPDVAALAITAAHTAALAVTEAPDVAALAINARHTASLAATEGADVAAINLEARHTAALAATEGADVAAFQVFYIWFLELAATEAADTAFFTLGDIVSTSLAATEAADTAAFNLAAAHTFTLAAAEAADVAAINLAAAHTASLAATEAADVAALSISAAHTASFAVTEAPDVAAFNLAAAHTAALAATEAGDTAEFSAQLYWTVTLEASEAGDTAAFELAAAHTAALDATETADVAAFVAVSANSVSLAATEAADVAAFALTLIDTAVLDATEAPDIAAFSDAVATVAAPSYSHWLKTKNKHKPQAPKLPEPMHAGEVVIDEAVIRQMEEERLAALVLEQKKAALERIDDLRAYAPAEKRPTKSVTIDPRRFDVVETTPEIRTRVINLFRPPEPEPLVEPVRGSITLRALGPRRMPEPEIRKAKTISLRRSPSQAQP